MRECFDPVWIASAADAFPAASLVMVSRDFLFDTLTLFSQAMTPFSSPDAIDTLFCSRLRHSQSSHSPKESCSKRFDPPTSFSNGPRKPSSKPAKRKKRKKPTSLTRGAIQNRQKTHYLGFPSKTNQKRFGKTQGVGFFPILDYC